MPPSTKQAPLLNCLAAILAGQGSLFDERIAKAIRIFPGHRLGFVTHFVFNDAS
jgi:hypothetical protein